MARRFHDATAHSYQSVRSSGHSLEWDTKPLLFKIYPDIAGIELPRSFDPLSVDALTALRAEGQSRAGGLDPEALAGLLFFSAGVTKSREYPGGGQIHFRAAASTGALYQTEVYVVARAVGGLPAGVYHFSPGDFRLRALREGDFRAYLAAAAADDGVASAPATLILSAIFWRNTWKYQARGYRHLFWDSGTMLANVLAVGATLGLAPRVLTGFVDDEVNLLLGLDTDREAALELVVLGGAATNDEGRARPPHGGHARSSGTESPSTALRPIAHPTVPLSTTEVDYPMLRDIHAASRLSTAGEVVTWRQAARMTQGSETTRGTRLPLPAARAQAERTLGETILRRGSTREFSHDPLTASELATALFHATRSVPADAPTGIVDVYLVVNAVDGIEPGAYRYDAGTHALELVTKGAFRRRSAHLCLEQALGGDAAAVVYFLSPLDGVLQRLGNRGYRLVNLEAGIIGGRAYLAAYAQGFGASGLTFYDRDVIEFFGRETTHDAIFVTALGRSATRAGPGGAASPPLRISSKR